MVLRRLGVLFKVRKGIWVILVSLSSNISGAKRNSCGKTPDPGGPLHRYGVRHL